MKQALYLTLTWILSLFFRPFKQGRNPRFLVVSTTGVGDTLWAVPALKALKARYPKSAISLLVNPTSKSLLVPLNLHTSLFELKSRSIFSFFKHFKSMRSCRFSHALVFHASQRPMLPFLRLIGARHIIGTKGINKGFDRYLTKATKNKAQHEIQRRLELVKLVGANPTDTALELVIPQKARMEMVHILKPYQIKNPIVVFHTGAKDSYKQWPLSHFIQVASTLAQDGYTPVVTGTHAEKSQAEHVCKKVPGALNLAGNLNLLELAALIERSNLLITNDTGPMHMGFALKKPTLAFFSPTDPKLCGPFHLDPSLYAICSAPPTCTPCKKRKCPEPFCLLQIGPETAIQKARALLINTETRKVSLTR